MQIQINTDRNIDGTLEVTQRLTELCERLLERFREDITRLEVHLSDVNGRGKGGANDIKCTIEARVRGRQPTVVTHEDAVVEAACRGALDKMRSALDSELGRLRAHR